ncbi:hypothetical protein ACI79D_21025 [Geodermatophilus sp. SYSU D00708]
MTDTHGRRGRWLLLATAVAQVVGPPVAGFDQGSDTDPVVVPPGPFFAIWGAIVLGCLAAAVWGLPLQRASSEPWRGVQLPLSLAQTGFLAWLVAAATLPVLTLPVFAGMVVALVVCLRRVVATRTDRVTRVLLGGSVGLYTGWASAAVWVNAATLLPAGAASATAPLAVLLTGAALTAAVLTRLVHGQIAYVLAAGWALLGVLVSTAGHGTELLSAVAAAGLAAVALTGATATPHRPG